MIMRGRVVVVGAVDGGAVVVVGGREVVVGALVGKNVGIGILVGNPDGMGNGNVGIDVAVVDAEGCGDVDVPVGGGLDVPVGVCVCCGGGGVYIVGTVSGPDVCVGFATGDSEGTVVGGGIGTVAVALPFSSLWLSFCDKYTPPITTPVTMSAMSNITMMPAPPLRCVLVGCPCVGT
jgi:hypothetical protein